ncbi:hypothetical protein M4D54_13675 [Brachybacterium sp. p3-SID1565]|uniref:VOC family protein n=1 Tax=Brachybacterium sp. p3-SID1565 TaxID=2916046 RepID=UPI0021A81797|nr:VOC family protein [Brachybacterium sp. p3-SID1565]MCT1386651.1 hypothetical protein [Brachybacterium sp. p3-SID1565]
MTPDPADSSTLTSPGASAVDERHLSADLSMDAVTLRVGDLETMSSYYENALALSPLEETARVAGEVHRVLGRGGVPFVRLVSTPGLPAVDPRQAGLFHTAFLFEDQASLAGTVLRAAQDSRSRFAGTGDHLVCRGAGPRAASLGLADVGLTLPAREDLDALAARLRAAGLEFADDGRSISVTDPWGTPVTASLPGTGVEELLGR